MAMRLEIENVRYLEHQVLDNLDYWEPEDKTAEKTLTYIAGVVDMADAVMKAIKELGGSKNAEN